MALFHTFSLPARNSGINPKKGKIQTPGNYGEVQQAAHVLYYLLHHEQKIYITRVAEVYFSTKTDMSIWQLALQWTIILMLFNVAPHLHQDTQHCTR